MAASKKFTLIIFLILLAGTIVAGAAYAMGMFDENISAEQAIYNLENADKIKAQNQQRLKQEEQARKAKSRKNTKDVYWQFDERLLANVYRSPKFIQVDLALLIKDNPKGEVAIKLKEHEFGLRNEMLNILSSQQEEQMASKFWRKDLAVELKNAANDLLEEKTGFREVQDVYFGELVVQ